MALPNTFWLCSPGPHFYSVLPESDELPKTIPSPQTLEASVLVMEMPVGENTSQKQPGQQARVLCASVTDP